MTNMKKKYLVAISSFIAILTVATLSINAASNLFMTEPPASTFDIGNKFYFPSTANSFIDESNPAQKNVAVITDNIADQKGAIWSAGRVDMSKAFTYQSDLYWGRSQSAPMPGNGGDGMTFTIHNDPQGIQALGEKGGALGAYDKGDGSGFVTNSISFEIDPFLNYMANDFDAGMTLDADINNSRHTAFVLPNDAKGIGNHHSLKSFNDYPTPIEDQWVAFNVTWTPSGANGVLTVELNSITSTYTINDYATFFGGNYAHLGFTGATGSNAALQAVAVSDLPPFTYNLNFDANLGSGAPAAQIVEEGTLFAAVPDPVRAGYDFMGWQDLTDSTTWQVGVTPMPSRDVTLTAQWSNAKYLARADLQLKADETIAAINALPGLTDAQKAAGIDAVNAELANGNAAIDAATTDVDVRAAYDTSAAIMDGILAGLTAESDLVINDAKTAANNTLNDLANQVKNAIDALPNLTPQQKADEKSRVDAALNDALAAVDAADTLAEIDTALTNGTNNINQVLVDATLADAKLAAKANLQAKADEVKAAINAIPGLSDQERLDAIAAIDAELAAGNGAIDAASNLNDVNTAFNTSVANMDAILAALEAQALADAKNAANTNLDNIANDAKNRIDSLPNLTDEEKAAAKDKIDSELANAKDAVNSSLTPGQVDTAVKDGTDAINNVVNDAILEDAKIGARADLEAKAKEVIDAINALPGLTDAEKAAGVQAINDELNRGLAAINAGTTVAEVTSAFNTSATNMDNILANLKAASDKAIDDAKNNARTELDNAANDAKNRIDSLPNLTDDEKAAAKDRIDSELANAKDAVNAGNNLNDINNALTNGRDAINGVVNDAVLADAKAGARAELEAKAKDVIDAINAMPGLTDEQRAAGVEAIKKELNDGLAAINAGVTVADVNTALNTSKANMKVVLAEMEALSSVIVDLPNTGQQFNLFTTILMTTLSVIMVVVSKRRYNN